MLARVARKTPTPALAFASSRYQDSIGKEGEGRKEKKTFPWRPRLCRADKSLPMKWDAWQMHGDDRRLLVGVGGIFLDFGGAFDITHTR